MTYPPQQPGPYGGPPPQGYGQNPWQGQYPSGGYPPPPPPPEPPQRNVGKIVAIVLIALLLLGGLGVGVYFLTREAGTTSAGTTLSESAPTSDAEQEPSSGPDAVVDEYITAYETKSFAAVTGKACAAYKKKYGMNTGQLEQQLEKYTITGSAQGEPAVKGDVATARIALELADDGSVKNVDIEIKIVKEDGEWRFCGEETA